MTDSEKSAAVAVYLAGLGVGNRDAVRANRLSAILAIPPEKRQRMAYRVAGIRREKGYRYPEISVPR